MRAKNILKLDLEETSIWGEDTPFGAPMGMAAEVLTPSRAGPVSQNPFMVREAEGPKHLYILSLTGRLEHFMAAPVGDKLVVKVGMSRSPLSRRDDHNRVFPNKCAFKWAIRASTFEERQEAFPTSAHAIAGENAMKGYLAQHATSLGGEFFLADEVAIAAAWQLGKKTASEFQP